MNKDFANCKAFCENGEFRNPFYNKIDSYKYINITFLELEAQYLHFISLTEGMGNIKHLDVHIYNNRSFPFACAYRKLIYKYNISSARYFATHHFTQKYSLYETYRVIISSLLCGHLAKVCKSDNIDYFINRKERFRIDDFIELYCHPDYINNILLDNTESVFGHKKSCWKRIL